MARKTRSGAARGTASKKAAETAPQKPHIVLSARDKQIRQRALALLRGETLQSSESASDEADTPSALEQQQENSTNQTVELPILYAALKRIKELHQLDAVVEDDSDLTADDLSLIQDASLAVPYLLYKRLCEQFMLPRNMGGMALSDANSKQLTLTLFKAMGPACCSESVTEKQVASKCCQAVKKKNMDTRTLILSLKAVGQEARSQLAHVEDLLTQGIGDEGAASEDAKEGEEAKMEVEDKTTEEEEKETGQQNEGGNTEPMQEAEKDDMSKQNNPPPAQAETTNNDPQEEKKPAEENAAMEGAEEEKKQLQQGDSAGADTPAGVQGVAV